MRLKGAGGWEKEKCCSSLWLLRCGCVLLAVAVVVTCWGELGAKVPRSRFPAFGGLDAATRPF
eukprot:3652613-Prymnesium_polylepis.1